MKAFAVKKWFSLQKPTRHSSFIKLDRAHIDYFSSFLPQNNFIVKTNENEMEFQQYNEDWIRIFKGQTSLVLKPSTVSQIQEILRYCSSKKIAVVPQGGNTGLVGGSVPVYDEVVISMSNLNKILKFDPQTKVLTCEAGCILQKLNEYLKEFNCEIPLDLGAAGSCHIGGNISTHAGGKYLIKYGPFRGNVLGLEIVLASGELLDLTSELRKDNTGFDLKQLFIGAEGTLGLVTKANINCVNLDKFKQVLFLRSNKFADVLKISKIAREALSRDLAAFEYLDSYAYNVILKKKQARFSDFFENGKNDNCFYSLLEIASNNSLGKSIEKLYENLSSSNCFEECLISENESQYRKIWEFRESCGAACKEVGPNFKYDVSLSPNLMNDLVEEIREKIEGKAYAVGYGHIGDGNLHINVAVYDKKDAKSVEAILEPFIFQKLKDCKGSISAEHGIGLMKAPFLNYTKPKNAIEYMKNIKNLLDPNGILNPYKVFI